MAESASIYRTALFHKAWNNSRLFSLIHYVSDIFLFQSG